MSSEDIVFKWERSVNVSKHMEGTQLRRKDTENTGGRKVWEADHRTGFSKDQPLLHPQTAGKQDPESPFDLPTSPNRTQVSSVRLTRQ